MHVYTFVHESSSRLPESIVMHDVTLSASTELLKKTNTHGGKGMPMISLWFYYYVCGQKEHS